MAASAYPDPHTQIEAKWLHIPLHHVTQKRYTAELYEVHYGHIWIISAPRILFFCPWNLIIKSGYIT